MARHRRRGPARNPWIREQESRTCRQCGAEPGLQCATSTGAFLTRPHMDRFYDAGGNAENDAWRVYDRKRKAAARQCVLDHYGTSCACCGTTERLTIDHIGGGGKQHREEIGENSHALYVWLIKNDFPPGFQTLCAPCNLSKADGERCRMHDNICPACHRPLDDGSTVTVKPWARRRKRSAHENEPADLQESA